MSTYIGYILAAAYIGIILGALHWDITRSRKRIEDFYADVGGDDTWM